VATSVKDVLETNAMNPSINVMVDIPDDLPFAAADERQIQIVLANLVRNARDAMPQGGTLAITGRAEAGNIAIRVADTGVGIPPDDLIRITEPLYTTKARGLGLGLAIARAILEKNGGTLHVTSELGRGSEFTVRLANSGTNDGNSSP
jgi:signal transduction histidine kinase